MASRVLHFESRDTFGVGIIHGKKILANIIDSYKTDKGGIHPTEAKEHHIKVADEVIKKALETARLKIEDIDLISFSQGPGLPPCLVVGLEKAKELAIKYHKPLIGVNHCCAHLEIGRLLTKAKDPVLLYVSGANTQVIAYESGKYRIFGETLDNGVGNFLDAFARELGIGFPGGPKIAELAEKSNNYIELPYVVKGMDVSFGGILTNLKQKIKKGYKIEDLAYSCQETVFAMLIEVAERALHHTNKKELLLGGGVACNKRLQEMAKQMCNDNNFECFILENQFNIDNGLMVAHLGLIEYKAGVRTNIDEGILPRQRTDDVKVVWG